VLGCGKRGGETARELGLSEYEPEFCVECGGVNEPKEEGENREDIKPGGEQLGGDAPLPSPPRFSFWRLEIARLSAVRKFKDRLHGCGSAFGFS